MKKKALTDTGIKTDSAQAYSIYRAVRCVPIPEYSGRFNNNTGWQGTINQLNLMGRNRPAGASQSLICMYEDACSLLLWGKVIRSDKAHKEN